MAQISQTAPGLAKLRGPILSGRAATRIKQSGERIEAICLVDPWRAFWSILSGLYLTALFIVVAAFLLGKVDDATLRLLILASIVAVGMGQTLSGCYSVLKQRWSVTIDRATSSILCFSGFLPRKRSGSVLIPLVQKVTLERRQLSPRSPRQAWVAKLIEASGEEIQFCVSYEKNPALELAKAVAEAIGRDVEGSSAP